MGSVGETDPCICACICACGCTCACACWRFGGALHVTLCWCPTGLSGGCLYSIEHPFTRDAHSTSNLLDFPSVQISRTYLRMYCTQYPCKLQTWNLEYTNFGSGCLGKKLHLDVSLLCLPTNDSQIDTEQKDLCMCAMQQ